MSILNLSEMKFSEIIKKNQELGKKLAEKQKYSISLISNITLNPLKDVLEFSVRSHEINAQVEIGDYDNFIQNTLNFSNSHCLVYFWELGNLISGFQYKADLLSETELNEIISKTKSEIKTCLNSATTAPLILFNKFSSLSFNYNSIEENALDYAAKELNDYVQSLNLKNLVFIDINKILALLGIENAISMQHYYASKSLYTVNFFKNYATFALPIIQNLCGKSRKALILDCDNTLWNGIVGEQGVEGINCSQENYAGEPFFEVQALVKKCAKQGIIIGLCSKNNSEDVELVLNKNPNIFLKQNEILIKKVNWENKTRNLSQIAKDLNIGIDSLVFVDDSKFEIDQVNEYLPLVGTLLVPAKSFNYPTEFKKTLNSFFQLSRTAEDKKKLQMYQEQSARDNEMSGFENIDEYLKNLKLKLNYKTQIVDDLPRLSQLTLKTNQFNTTTRRYSEAELQQFYGNGSILVSYKLDDKYGDYGIIGFIMSHIQNDTADLDVFLMSCRAIGRQVEFSMFESLLSILKEKGIKKIQAMIIKNTKNIPVQNLYSDLGFKLDSTDGKNEEILIYSLNLTDYKFPISHFVESTNADR